MAEGAARRDPPPSLAAALLPVAVLFGLFAAGAALLDSVAELLIVAMLGATAVAAAQAALRGRSWREVEQAAAARIAGALPAVLILLAVGMLIGTWILSGTIPYLVYAGVRLVSPQQLVVTSFVATALMSLCTGTSFGSAGTIGVALMGLAAATGAPLAPVAGAIVSGAYLGDKMSPLSDTTNVAALAASADLYRHVWHMLYTALPSTAVALVVYSLTAGAASGAAAGADQSARLLAELERGFRLHPLALLPALIAVAAMLRRVPAALAIALSSASALLLGLTLQGFPLASALAAAVSGFEAPMLAARGLAAGEASPALVALVQRGGLASMAPTLVVVIAAFLTAGALEVSGSLERLIGAALAAARGSFGLVASTMLSGSVLVSLTSHASVAALIVGGLFQPLYRERGLAPENLSRSIEDSVTLVEPLLPWTVSALFMATTLGVPTTSYAPWALFCLTGPLFSLAYAAAWPYTGFGLRRLAPLAAAGERA